jgi:Protein of unknown function (DUF3761)
MVTRNVRLRALSVLGCVGLLAACGSIGDKNAASSSSVSTNVIEALTTPSETAAPTTSERAVPARLVDDCVGYVQFGALTGIAPLVAMWNDAGQDASTLRTNCDSLGRANLAELQNMSVKWADVETYIAATQAAATTLATPPPTAPPLTQPPQTLPPPPAAPVVQAPTSPACGEGSYVNVDGNCISGPVAAPSAPAGATAKCRDGTYSFSQHRSGTCSHHGGVATWL